MWHIHARTQVCAVFGHPVGHSLSPHIHNAAFQALDLPYVYVAHDIPPGGVAQALHAIRVLGYRGLSITIPHKVEALGGVDEVDAAARVIGCINTVVNDQGRLLGCNSDGPGALQALREAGADPQGRRVLVLGSGGAARAVAVTLAIDAPPAQLTILGIDRAELERLAEDVRRHGHAPVRHDLLTDDALRAALADADLLLHCSPVGMHPRADASLVPPAWLQPHLVVFDAVYNPRETSLIRAARQAGCRTILGLEMFLGQAFVQFERWTGCAAPRDVMRQIVEARL